jgi:hypothetical protein
MPLTAHDHAHGHGHDDHARHACSRRSRPWPWSCRMSARCHAVPLAVLSLGAVLAGIRLQGFLHRPRLRALLEDARCSSCPTTTSSTSAHDVPLWVKSGRRLRRHADRLPASPLHVRPRPETPASSPPAIRALQVPAQQVVLRRALRLPVRAAGDVARPLPVEEGRRPPSSTASARRASRPVSSTSPPGSSSCSPATSTTMPSPC